MLHIRHTRGTQYNMLYSCNTPDRPLYKHSTLCISYGDHHAIAWVSASATSMHAWRTRGTHLHICSTLFCYTPDTLCSYTHRSVPHGHHYAISWASASVTSLYTWQTRGTNPLHTCYIHVTHTRLATSTQSTHAYYTSNIHIRKLHCRFLMDTTMLSHELILLTYTTDSHDLYS